MIIGFTGHRPNRLHIGEARVAARLREVLAGLRDGAQARNAAEPLIALSPLAEGSDRLFAEAALELGYGLRALLPFMSADYETTFSDASTTPVYRALLARATQVNELPGSLSDTTAAYEAVGRAMVEASDILVAVWDGKPAAGRGGTPEIIAYAIERGSSVIWVDAATDRAPMQLSSIAPKLKADIATADSLAALAASLGRPTMSGT